MELFLKIFLLLGILTHVIESEVVLSSDGDRLDLYEGVQYQLINRKSGNQLKQAKEESSVDTSSTRVHNEFSKPSSSDPKQYLILWSASKTETTNNNHYELIFMSGTQQNKFRVTVEKSPLLDYYRFREYNSDSNSTRCPLTQTIGGFGTFQCNSDEDTALWKPHIYAYRYNLAAQFHDFVLIGDVDQEIEKTRAKLTIVDGEVINNPQKHPIDHFVTNFPWFEDYREKISIDFDSEYYKFSTLTSSKKFRINLKIPVNRANSISKKFQNKLFNFERFHFSDSNTNSRRYPHLSLDRVTVEPFECIEYYSYADVVDSAVLPFQAKTTLTVIGSYGPFDIRSYTKFPVEFAHSLLKSKGVVKLADNIESTANEIVFTVKGNMTTTLVLGVSNLFKTVTGEPVCDHL